ncbi:uncharacterized protein LOC143377773 isoform X2 [Andrena cerasifolii]|uniref:uncharacterized protein LOC143377773 isoform X2 n=1 Tax=Andrena cerasifolii TaxID=2819439 RepID=UPI00403822B8
MAINIKFTKFDNTPWGFRLAGGSDFPQPLTVIKVLEGSLAECMGMKVGDVVVRLNDQPIGSLTHGQAHEELVRAGNNFVLGVQRGEDYLKAVEGLSEENIVPYKIPLADLPPVFPEQILKEETVIERYEETTYEEKPAEEEAEPEVEPLPDKPKDANSEIVPNQNLTDDEIAQLILEEEELLNDQGVLGVNFKKLRPRLPVLKQSKVVEELQNIATAEPPLVEQLRRTSVFLQKPQRPVPVPRKKQEEEEELTEVESYKVVIKKQQKRSITDRLLERGLLRPEGENTPEPPTPEATPSATPEPDYRSDQEREAESRPESKAESKPEESESEQRSEGTASRVEENVEAEGAGEEVSSQEQSTKESVLCEIEKEMADLASKVDKEKIKELVSTELDLEKQLENVQRQLLALKQLPSEIESHLRIVSEQLQKIMELSGVQNGATDEARREPEAEREEVKESEDEEPNETEDFTEYTEEITFSAYSDEHQRVIVEPSEEEEEEETETQELEGTLSVKSEEGCRVKKFVVSYETKVLKSPSPAPSHGSFEPDPNLSPKDQVIQELQQKVQDRRRKRSEDLWPQAKQVELTLGRRWRCPNDFFNDEMIAEVLSSQAEVIRGRALGVNFKKYEKTNLPNYDHLMGSSVYKMIHKMDREPKKGIPARPAKVNAAEDIIERAKSPALSVADDRSTRSVSH